MNFEQKINTNIQEKPEFLNSKEKIEPNGIPITLDKEDKVESGNQKENSEKIEALKKDIIKIFDGESSIEGNIKSGVERVYIENPELASVGTPEDYSKYLETIFPDSKIKDILYRQDALDLENFKASEETKGIYASADIKEVDQYRGRRKAGESKIYSVMFNIKNPKEYQLRYYSIDLKHTTLTQAISEGNDGILTTGRDGEKNIEVAVINPEQTMILGSKQDVEKFKKYMSENI
jgi:hypothetical protein